MLKSMTAYGRGSLNTKVGHFLIEIQSVNRKFLEINAILPRELSPFDTDLKKWLSPYVARGQVTVKGYASFEDFVPFVVRANLPFARQLKKAWMEMAKELSVDETFNLSWLKGTERLLLFEENRQEEENCRQFLKQAFELALKNFLEMKAQEGALLQVDVESRLKKMDDAMHLIEQKSSCATNRYRDKLMARLEELLPGHVENAERILREVALFAEKLDITEEITRFYCHLTHFKELLQSEALSVGKTLEFVLQELNREVNTIGSKSSEIEIARTVIEIKSELERIREQIQNVE